MAQSWRGLLFAHWPVAPELLARVVPAALPIDTFDGQAWVGVVPFDLRGLRPRGLPAVPWLSNFAELNVRTYVTLEGKPGVYFFSLDAARLLAVLGARLTYHLPYYHARMSVRRRDDEVTYASTRIHGGAPPAVFRARYRPTGRVFNAAPGTLDHFLTERYCLYAVDGHGVYRAEIHHPPWPLQPATAEIAVNSMAGAHGIPLPAVPPLLHFARRQDMVAWPVQRVGR